MKRNGIPEVTCSHCKGTGRMKLQDGLLVTLNILRRDRRKWLTVQEVRLQTPRFETLNPTGINNRLRFLYDMGMALRERSGRLWLYKAKI